MNGLYGLLTRLVPLWLCGCTSFLTKPGYKGLTKDQGVAPMYNEDRRFQHIGRIFDHPLQWSFQETKEKTQSKAEKTKGALTSLDKAPQALGPKSGTVTAHTDKHHGENAPQSSSIQGPTSTYWPCAFEVLWNRVVHSLAAFPVSTLNDRLGIIQTEWLQDPLHPNLQVQVRIVLQLKKHLDPKDMTISVFGMKRAHKNAAWKPVDPDDQDLARWRRTLKTKLHL
jgi:hypothetical protein